MINNMKKNSDYKISFDFNFKLYEFSILCYQVIIRSSRGLTGPTRSSHNR